MSSRLLLAVAASAFVAILVACGSSSHAPGATPTVAVTAGGSLPPLPPAAEQALGRYVQSEKQSPLLGPCGPPFGAGWCYFNVTGGGDHYVVALGLNGAGLPTWTIELLRSNGSFEVVQVTENRGKE